MNDNGLTTLFLRVPRNNETTSESVQTFLATMTQLGKVGTFAKLRGKHSQRLSLEIALINQQIHFLITCDRDLATFVTSQLQSNYPLIIIEEIIDPASQIQNLHTIELTLKKGNFYPINTYPLFVDIDPLSSMLSVLSTKGDPNEFVLVQIALEGSVSAWQKSGQQLAETGGGKKEDGSYVAHPHATIIKEKIAFPGFRVSLKIASNSTQTLSEIANTFGVFTRSDGNSFGKKKSKNSNKSLLARTVDDKQILNIVELATLWHLPNEKIKTASIAWGNAVLSEAPANLPSLESLPEEEKKETTFFAKTPYKNKETIFGIKKKDRRRHVWVVGKTGTGKSTMIANMAINDVFQNRGIGIIDPHGELVETVMQYIPKERIDDVIYFNPADRDFPIVINPLEVENREEAELVVSGIMSVFTKVWANVWSARMEYILRNALLTLSQVEDTTLSDVLKLLTDNGYRNRCLQKISDENLAHFWIEEYNKMPDRLQKEAISPIQNKVGQFVTSPMIRRIIGHPKSTVKLDEIMDGQKILLANLSQGRIGEDNSALLGAVLITKLQQAAMRRVNIPEDDRRDFYLYVDEFQNFATTSFIKILSEARKYRLNLMLANQYMAQIPDDVQKAILGNVGSLVSFAIGAEDAEAIHKEYAEVFSQNDLVNLSNFQIAIKEMIDGHASRPFIAYTLPLPANPENNIKEIIQKSRTQWTKKFEEPIIDKPITHQPSVPTNSNPIVNKLQNQLNKQNMNFKPRPNFKPKNYSKPNVANNKSKSS